MSKRIQFFVGARAIIIKDKKILMGFEPKREHEHWETPGGHIEADENIIDGLKREVMEEVGAEIEVKNQLPFFFSYDGSIVKEEYRGNSGIQIYFVCNSLTNPDLKKATEKEFSELKFIGKEEFEKLLKENKIMIFDKLFLPEIIKKLKLW